MFQIRESNPDDLEQIFAVAEHLDTVNLPADRGRIGHLLELSQKSFDQSIPAAEREYLFVLEDTSQARVIGTSMIHAQHGTRRAPHIFFRVESDERYSVTLDRYFVHTTLRIGYNYNGPTEIGGLILLPEYRGVPEQLGKLLSYTRFLFMAMHRPVFREQVLSELLPPLEADGTSLLWKHLGHNFTGLTYQEADILSKDNKEFIHALFPHEPIYTALLPADVEAILGQVGAETKGVEKMLRRIGFSYAGQIDPFDGGPHFVAETDKISIVREARRARVSAVDAGEDSPWGIVAVDRPRKGAFRAMRSRVALGDVDVGGSGGDGAGVGLIALSAAVRAALGLEAGDEVWAVTA
jgi:arginine N-succinyltransferase